MESSPDVDQELETENEKTRFLRLQIAKKNRKITALQRNISEVPSRAELAQYQRRFLELYNQGKICKRMMLTVYRYSLII